MIRRAMPCLGAAALIAQVVFSFGCSSADSGATGTGGSSGTGAGGMSGAGGTSTTGAGGAGGASASAPVGDPCPSGVKNKGACTTEPACWNTCGPLKSGFKDCACSGGMWSCPTCAYYPEDMTAHNYSCYKIPANIALCPADSTDPTGAGLPQSGATCAGPTCMACGSASSNAYRDSTGTPKIGYCVCSAADGTGTYSCASLQEWAPASMF